MAGCSPTWTVRDDRNIGDGIWTQAESIEECRNVCSVNPTCKAINWADLAPTKPRCWLHGTWRTATSTRSSSEAQHHAITRTCGQQLNISSWNHSFIHRYHYHHHQQRRRQQWRRRRRWWWCQYHRVRVSVTARNCDFVLTKPVLGASSSSSSCCCYNTIIQYMVSLVPSLQRKRNG